MLRLIIICVSAQLVLASAGSCKDGTCEKVADKSGLKEELPRIRRFSPELLSTTSMPNLNPSVFLEAEPYPHVVIDNFLRPEVLSAVQREFAEYNDYFSYENPVEHKYAQNLWHKLPYTVRNVLETINSNEFVDWVINITGIPGLQADPFLHGGGMHKHPPGSYLNMHVDYSIHPVTLLERRLNFILYVSESWESETEEGCLQMWKPKPDSGTLRPYTRAKTILPLPNRLILFSTSDLSLHGLPTPVPKDHMRISLASYYVSQPRPEATHRYKAQYFPVPGDEYDPLKAYLYHLRPHRRIEQSDVDTFEFIKKLVLANDWPHEVLEAATD